MNITCKQLSNRKDELKLNMAGGQKSSETFE